MNPNSSPSSSRGRPPRRAAAAAAKRKYFDSELDSLIPTAEKKRLKTLDSLQKETKKEALIALSLGFPIDALLPSESIPPSFSQNDYIVIRNHILAAWRSNVSIYLLRSRLKETISSEYDVLINAVYDFLNDNGYINFGVSDGVKSFLPEVHDKGSVAIVGSGLAGLAAARQLLAFGFKVFILEGKQRPGGRVYTAKVGEENKFAGVELGGSVITGVNANPLGVLARQLGIPLHKIKDKCPLYKRNGMVVDEKLDVEIGKVFNVLLEQTTKVREVLGEEAGKCSLGMAIEKIRELYGVAREGDERELLEWHLANLEYANAGSLSDLSLAYWDQDDPYEMDGDHCFLAGGNWRLINALCENVPILYGKTVVRIMHNESGVDIEVEDGQVFKADMTLCTVPLGVLKRKIIKFEPELPNRKVEAIERLGFGLLNKVAMVFPHVFWEEDLDTFGCLNKERSKRGEFFLFYNYHAVSGGAVLIALVAGEAAEMVEHVDPVDILHQVLEVLREMYKPRGIEVPDPIQTVCTKWGSDPLISGSYSHIRVGSSGDDYDILAENINRRLFFAGEATSRQYPATMHGAFLSGLREAASILQTHRDRSGADTRLKKCPQNRTGQSADSLAQLFDDPDETSGNFSFVFDPYVPEAKGMGIMRYGASGKCSFYVQMSREQAHKMKLACQDDEGRLAVTMGEYGLSLMGFEKTCADAGALIAKILGSKRKWNRQRQRRRF